MVSDRHTPGRDASPDGLAVLGDAQQSAAAVKGVCRDGHEALALQSPHGIGDGRTGDPEAPCQLGRPHRGGPHEPKDAHLDRAQPLCGRHLLKEDALHLAEPLQSVGDRRGGGACYHCPSAT